MARSNTRGLRSNTRGQTRCVARETLSFTRSTSLSLVSGEPGECRPAAVVFNRAAITGLTDAPPEMEDSVR
jgi:hypothetical protein